MQAIIANLRNVYPQTTCSRFSKIPSNVFTPTTCYLTWLRTLVTDNIYSCRLSLAYLSSRRASNTGIYLIATRAHLYHSYHSIIYRNRTLFNCHMMQLRILFRVCVDCARGIRQINWQIIRRQSITITHTNTSIMLNSMWSSIRLKR